MRNYLLIIGLLLGPSYLFGQGKHFSKLKSVITKAQGYISPEKKLSKDNLAASLAAAKEALSIDEKINPATKDSRHLDDGILIYITRLNEILPKLPSDGLRKAVEQMCSDLTAYRQARISTFLRQGNEGGKMHAEQYYVYCQGISVMGSRFFGNLDVNRGDQQYLVYLEWLDMSSAYAKTSDQGHTLPTYGLFILKGAMAFVPDDPTVKMSRMIPSPEGPKRETVEGKMDKEWAKKARDLVSRMEKHPLLQVRLGGVFLRMKYKGLKKKKTEEYYEQFYSTFAETIRKEVEHFYHDMPKYQRLQCYWLLVSEGKLSYRSKKNGVEAGVCVLVEYMFSKGDVYFNALDMATSHLIRQSDIKKLETFSRYVDVFIRRPDFTMLDNEESKAYIPEVILQKWKGGLPAYLDWSRHYQADLAKRAGDPTLIPDARVISKPEKRSLWKKAKVVYDLKKKRYGLQKVLALIPGKGGTYILASGEDKRKFCQLIWIGDDNKARELTRLEVEIPESRIPYLNCRLAPDGGYIMVHYTKGPVYALNANPKATRFGRRAYGLPRLAATTACPGNDVIYFISDDKLWAWYFITKKESVLSSRPPLVKFHAQPLHQLNVKSMTFDAQKDRLLALGEVAVGQRQNIPAEPKGLWSFNLVTHEWGQLLENGYGITDGVITTGSDNRIRVGTKTFLGYFDTKNDSLSLQFSLGSWGPKLPRGFIVEPVNKAAVNLKRSEFPAKPLRGRVNEFHWIDANGVFWEFNDEISCISVKDGNEYIAPLTGRKEKIILLAPGPTDKTLVMATEHRVWKLLMPDLSR